MPWNCSFCCPHNNSQGQRVFLFNWNLRSVYLVHFYVYHIQRCPSPLEVPSCRPFWIRPSHDTNGNSWVNLPTYDTCDGTGRGLIGPYDQIRNRSWYFSFSLSCYFSFLYLIFVFSLSLYFSGCARLSCWGYDLKLLPNHRAMGDFFSVCQAYFLMTSSGRLFQSFTIGWVNEWALILVLALFLGSLSLWPRVVESFNGDSKLGRVGLYTLCSSL